MKFNNEKPIVSAYFAFLPEHPCAFVVVDPDEVWIGCGSYGAPLEMQFLFEKAGFVG